ncbi:MAG TPA: CHAD domain-containing protein [Candidatus Babeliales bacterium]|jgi:CHAD domain-containing protein|nr:CHAD domain-containing protein [Candidatus Babeliales bacterium]
MAFRLKLREALPKGLKQVFCEQIDSALRCCQHPARQRGVTVHEVRKHLKKLRAAMRLAIGAVGKNCHAEENRCVRNIGRLVSDLRDAQVRLQTFIQLRDKAGKHSDKQLFPRTEELLLLERESFSAAFAGWQRKAIPQLENVKARLMNWPLDDLNWKQICSAVCRIYRRGQRALAKTIDDPEPENFHAWRKRVKDVWYELRILQPLNRTVLEEMAHDAEVLGELLGSEHDLEFLRARLEKETGDEALTNELTKIQKLITKRCDRLRRDALELGRRFYAEPSKAFAKRISIFADTRT